MNKLKTTLNGITLLIMSTVILTSLSSCETWKMKRQHKKHISRKKDGDKSQNTKFIDCYDCVPEECVENACTNIYCQQTIRECHKIPTKTIFENKIKSFTGGTIYPGKNFPATHIDSLIDNPNCNNQQIIQLCADHSSLHSNSEILIGKYPIINPYCDPARLRAKLDMDKMAKYSRAFFAGIMQLEPDSFYFYKAKGKRRDPNQDCLESIKDDIILKAVKFDIDGNEETVYYGNASDLLP